MKKTKYISLVIPFVSIAVSFLPIHMSVVLAAEKGEESIQLEKIVILESGEKQGKATVPEVIKENQGSVNSEAPLENHQAPTPPPVVTKKTEYIVHSQEEEQDDSFQLPSKSVMIGVGAALVVGVGGILALGGGGGSESAPPPVVVAPTPPTADNFVSPWQAAASQAGSGKSYTGVYHLYQGGGLGYDILISDGQHLVGGGNWWLDGYNLNLHTDHGSLYRGTVKSGKDTSVSLAASTGWSLTLAR